VHPKHTKASPRTGERKPLTTPARRGSTELDVTRTDVRELYGDPRRLAHAMAAQQRRDAAR
jgi:hypothetical protein